MTRTPVLVSRVKKMSACLVVLLIAFSLKAYYSRADSDDLAWIIGPTALLAEQFSGLSFVREPGFGWLNLENKFVIVPACAGMNFLIIAFSMSAFQAVFSKNNLKQIAGWVIFAGAATYIVTLIANAVRIWLSMIFYQADIYSAWFTQQAVHRIVGITVYYLFLCFYFKAASFILCKELKTMRLVVFFIPLFWYLLFSLGVPYMNNAYRLQPERFLEHMLSVGGTSLLLTLVLLFLTTGCRFSAFWLSRRKLSVLNEIVEK